MSQHTGQHMVSPPGKLPHLVVIHPQVRFGFLKALLDGPANPREPDEGFQTSGSAGVRDGVGINGTLPKSSANDQPDCPVGLLVFTQNDPALHELVGYRPLRPLGNRPAIPEIVVRSSGDPFKGDRLLLGFRKDAFRPLLSAVPEGSIFLDFVNLLVHFRIGAVGFEVDGDGVDFPREIIANAVDLLIEHFYFEIH